MAVDEHEGRHVVQHSAHAGDETVAADRGVVVHADAARDRGVIVNMDVAAQQRAVGHDDMVAQAAIVGHVRAGHEEVVAADRGDAVFLFGGAVDRDAFANAVRVADDDLRFAAAIADILRLAADDDAGIDVVVLADRDVTHDGHVVFQPRSRGRCGPAGR